MSLTNVPHKNRTDKIKQLIRANATITRQEIADILHVHMKTIGRDIKQMPDVHYIGSGNRGHWQIDE